MTDEEKTKEQLIEELTFMRRRIAELEATESKRKLAEDALRESEDSFRQLAENTKKVLWIADRDITETLYVSPAYEEIWGRTCASLSANPRSWIESVHPEDLDLATKSLAERGSDGPSMKYRIVRPDGSIRWILDRGFPVRDETGEIYRFAGIAEDITERVQQEREIQLLNRLYGVLRRVSQAVVWATSAEPFLEEACRVIMEEGGFLLSWIGYVEVATKRVVPTAICGEAGDYVRGISVYVDDRPESRGPTGTCIREERPSVHNHFLHSPLTLPWRNRAAPYGIRAAAAFPIRSAARVWGALTIYSDQVDFFGDQDVKLLEKVADDIGFALDNLEGERRRQKAEAALRESEDRYRAFLDASSDMVYVKDDQLRHVIANNTLLHFFGRVEADVIGRTDFELMPELAARNCRSSDLEAIRAKSLVVTEERVGDRIYETTKFPVVLKGNKIGVGGIIRDITERKQAEMELLREKLFTEKLLESLPGIFFLYDSTCHLKRWNKAHETAMGFSADELRDWYIPDWHETPEDAATGMALVKSVLETGIGGAFETTLINKDGRFVPYLISITRLSTPDGPAMMGVGIDITERKRAEAALEESQRQLGDIINFLPDATLVIDKNGKVIAWNRAIEAMTGVKAEEMVGKENYEYSLPFYGERRRILIDLALRQNQENEKDYTAIQRRGDIIFGEAFTPNLPPGNVHLSATASVLRDSKGEIVAAIECIRDNTERRRLEERLNRAEKMEALGTLAGGVAHDLNNVLGILVGYSELLLEKIPKGNPSNRHVSYILQASERGAAIIQDLLTLARRGVAVSEVVNLNNLVSSLSRSPEYHKLKEHHPNITFRIDLQKGLFNIKGSPVHLEKMVMNLISNAAEAILDKGEVTIRTENRYLDRPIRGYDEMQEGDYVVLTVSDNGKGIPQADLEKIFEPFYTKKVMGRSGTGLGLAVVWGTVKDHAGYIDVESEEGKGSTFTLYFPVSREELTKDEDKASPDQYMGDGESILVVDDVEGQRELALSMLTRLGYRVHAVSRGEDAVAYLKSNKVDLLVLDMIMEPGIDGLETYQHVLEINPKQRAVIVSGFSETDRVKKAQSLGAGAYVKKPYVLEKLGLAVRKELDRAVLS